MSYEDNEYSEIFDPRDDEDIDFNQCFNQCMTEEETETISVFDRYSKQQITILCAMAGMLFGAFLSELKHLI